MLSCWQVELYDWFYVDFRCISLSFVDEIMRIFEDLKVCLIHISYSGTLWQRYIIITLKRNPIIIFRSYSVAVVSIKNKASLLGRFTGKLQLKMIISSM